MKLVKLNATNSTNTYLKALNETNFVEDFTIVSTKEQTNGRGQMGAVWQSQASKNLMFSVFKDVSKYKNKDSFYICIVTTLSLLKALKSLNIPRLSVKWPNDILSANKKICGVLIENVIKKSQMYASIIGIGLNVNQIEFENLPRASSLKLISGKTFDLDELTMLIVKYMKAYFDLLKNEKFDVLKTEYEANLFRKNKPSTFKNAEGVMFTGFIKSVSESGHLQVLLEDNILKAFDLKEITLLY